MHLDSLRRTRFLTTGLQGSRGEESTEITKLRRNITGDLSTYILKEQGCDRVTDLLMNQ